MTLEAMTVDDLLAAIADRTPTPGGGAVASLTAATAAALAQMVVAFSSGKKSLAEHAPLHEEAATALDAWRAGSLRLAQEDADAYACLNTLWKLPEDDARRRAEFAAAVEGAIAVPRRVAEHALDALKLLERLAGRTSRMLASDLAIAAVLAEAAARAALWNVRINLPLLTDDGARREHAEACDRLAAGATALARAIETACTDSSPPA